MPYPKTWFEWYETSLREAGYKLREAGYKLREADYKLREADYKLRGADLYLAVPCRVCKELETIID
ncbi:hypothetical protein ACO1O0_006582 [Amphichorda felina]